MEHAVMYLCAFWFWLTRKSRSMYYQQVAHYLEEAKIYLSDDFNGWASTRDRGALLPRQIEALNILEHQREMARQTSSRFHSFSECVRMVAEDFADPPKAACGGTTNWKRSVSAGGNAPADYSADASLYAGPSLGQIAAHEHCTKTPQQNLA
jgi:hypothetical protein